MTVKFLTSNGVDTHLELSLLSLWLLACVALDRVYGVGALLLDLFCLLERCGGIIDLVADPILRTIMERCIEYDLVRMLEVHLASVGLNIPIAILPEARNLNLR